MQKTLLLFISLLTVITASAETFKYTYEGQTLTYETVSGGCKVTSDQNCRGAVKIPQSAISNDGNEYPVKVIASFAFQGCSGLTSVEIPNSVTDIGFQAFMNCSGLTSVVIPNSVTVIGKQAFQGCSGLTSVEIPNSVTSIGQSTFSNCTSLTSVVIPNSVTSIEPETFQGCSSLTSVEIPNSVTSIGGYAFYDCRGLTSVEIPNSVTSIGNSAFSGCTGLKSLIVEYGESAVTINNGAFADCSIDYLYLGRFFSNLPLINAKSVTLSEKVTALPSFAFSDCRNITSVTIPNSVTSIGVGAFSGCTGLTSVEIPNSVTVIGNQVFECCSGLTSVVIPNSVTGIWDLAFYGCSSLMSVEIPNSVTYIGGRAFQGCSGLTSVVIPNSVTSIEPKTFQGCSSLTSVEIPNSVTSIGGNAFEGCRGLTSLEIPNSVTSIEQDAFSYCTSLKSLIVQDGEGTVNISPSAFFKCNIDNVYIGHNFIITDGYPSAFRDAKSVILGEKVTDLPNNAFYGCKNLTSLEIPNLVTSIGNSAFNACPGLTSIEIPNSVTSIGNSAFSGCSGLESIEIPSSVKSVGDAAFNGCTGLKSISIADAENKLLFGENAFQGVSNIEKVYVGRDFGYYGNTTGSGPFYEKSSIKELRFSNSVKEIAVGAFQNCSGIEYLEIPNSVTTIGKWAFSECSSLKCVILKQSVNSVGIDAFRSCTGLIKSAYPESLKSNPFSNGQVVEYPTNDVVTDDGLIYGKDNGVFYFASLYIDGEYIIPNIIKTIGEHAFYACSRLESVEIPTTVEHIGEHAFEESGIKNIKCNATEVPKAFESSFTGLYDTALLTVPSESYIDYAYAVGWSEFVNMNTGNGVVKIGSDDVFTYKYNTELKEAFIIQSPDYKNMTNLSIPRRVVFEHNGVEEFYQVIGIGNNAFENCSINTITFGSSLKWIGESAFRNCGKIETLDFNASLETIGDNAFAGTEINTVNCNESLLSIGNNAFSECGIKNLNFNNNLQNIGSSAFAYNGMETIDMSGTRVESIGNSAFEGCSDVKNLLLSEYLVSIGQRAFALTTSLWRCSVLKVLHIPETLKQVGAEAFDNTIVENVFVDSFETWCDIDFGNISANPLYLSFKNTKNILHIANEPLGKSVNVPSTIKELKSYTFVGLDCDVVTIPESIQRISHNAFSPMNRLDYDNHNFAYFSELPCEITHLNILDGESPIVIEYNAFDDLLCVSLYLGRNTEYTDFPFARTLIIGNCVSEIPDNFYNGNSLLSEASFGLGLKTIGAGAFESTSLTSIVIPPFVESIGDNSFKNCKLSTIYMGCGVKHIGEYAFDGNNNIEEICVTALNPPTANNNSFSNYYSKLRVPESAMSSYADCTRCWYRFENQIAVLAEPERVEVNRSSLDNVLPGICYQLRATVYPSEALSNVFWKSTNRKVAQVDTFGNVSISTGEELTDLDVDCEIQAYNLYSDMPVASIKVSGVLYGLRFANSSEKLSIGEDAILKLIKYGNLSELTWYSSNPEVAKVDDNGNITPLKIGETTITVSAKCLDNNQQVKASCYVLVNNKSDYSLLYSYNDRDFTATLIGMNAACAVDLVIPKTTSYGRYNYSVTGIDESAFTGSAKEFLRSVSIPETVTTIEHGAFNGCFNLETVYYNPVNASNGSKDRPMFGNCPKFKNLYIGEKVERIPCYMFMCTELEKLDIPDNVEYLDRYSFYSCTNLSKIRFGKNAVIESLSFDIPDGIEPVETELFFSSVVNCNYHFNFANRIITSLVLGPNVQTIDCLFFSAPVYDIFCHSNLPPSIPLVNNGYSINVNVTTCRLHVPVESEELYRKAYYWKNFYNIIADLSGVDDVIIALDDSDAPVEVYNLNGLKVADSTELLVPGLYIVRQGRTVKKIVVK